jgi:hypothetical protein
MNRYVSRLRGVVLAAGLSLCWGVVAQAAEFSADMIHMGAGQTIKGKVYVKGNRVRNDMQSGSDRTVNITDLDARYKKFNEVEAIVYEEQPMIIVAYYGCAIVKNDNLKGYVFDPTAHDYRINTGMYMEN